jgi:hypothetical protein
MNRSAAMGAAWLLATGFGLLAAAGPQEQAHMVTTASDQHFGPFVFRLPAGYTQLDDTTEQVPARIPGAKPTQARFRSFAGPQGLGLYFFHWEGLPQRDSGPMKAEQTWEIQIGGQPATLSRTEMFFGRQQRVLSAHFKSPTGDQCLIYQRTADPAQAPEREPFLALLASIRFEPESIGAASMEPDGTILLQLRASDGAGALGDALLRYPPSDPEYKAILKHLGGLEPGQHKPVKPFPEKR